LFHSFSESNHHEYTALQPLPAVPHAFRGVIRCVLAIVAAASAFPAIAAAVTPLSSSTGLRI
jgi:hypothetical protein